MGETTYTRQNTGDRADIYQRITDSIAAAIEKGAGEWRMPWHSKGDGVAPVLPVNVAAARLYRGVNTVVLWASAEANAYGSAVWGTYRQWKEHGAQVRKGEHASPVCSGRSPTVTTKTAALRASARPAPADGSSLRATTCSTRPRWTATRPLPCPSYPQRSGSSTRTDSSPPSALASGRGRILLRPRR